MSYNFHKKKFYAPKKDYTVVNTMIKALYKLNLTEEDKKEIAAVTEKKKGIKCR